MDEYQSKLEPGKIQFHEWCEPPIEPGDYSVDMNHDVTQLDKFQNDFSFSVAGPRFTLNPADVYCVYPPQGHVGDFSNTLPHIVFTRRTLPWERSIYPGPRQSGDRLPWMALLVFSAADFRGNKFPELKMLTVGNLINPKPTDPFVGPKLSTTEGDNGLEAYESEADVCNTIELPWELFQQVAPTKEDLAYLAHVREVNTGNKETLSFLADGWFSVALANRFPEPERPLSADSLLDAASVITKIRTAGDAVSSALWQEFSGPAQAVLKVDTSDASEQQHQRSVLLDELNRIIQGRSIYDDARFAEVALSAGTIALREKLKDHPPEGSETCQFNKLLLQDAYPLAIVRRPSLPVENRAYLVSLEGMTDYLPGPGSTANKPVRLAVLSSWSFYCQQAFAFKDLMNKLNVHLLRLPLMRSPGTDAENKVNDAWRAGFTALNHQTRLGERAVSWYRGPLVPLQLAKQTNFAFRPAADAALRYSPADGMLDVSYAAAYQLGRLLALQDRHFATALYSYRTGVQRQINEVLSRKKIESIFKIGGASENQIMSAYLESAGSGNGQPAGWAASTPAIQAGNGGDDPNTLKLTSDFDLTIPQAVCQWLARLLLLYRVPFANLVADENMLPADSLRFFYLDPNWLKCLLEGACSVGRSSPRDELVDEELRHKFLDFALEQSLEVRTRTPANGGSDPIPVQRVPAKLPDWPLTGFLLRSEVVKGWQGLEMRAWKDHAATQPLDALRIDRLAPDIMLCIFNGQVNRIEVKQPPEGMHFGAAVDTDGSFTRFHLRRLNDTTDKNDEDDGIAAGPGHQLIEKSKTVIPLRAQNLKRVADVFALAKTLKANLESMNARDTAADFTSADFGVEMVESPGRVIFDVNNPEES